MTFYLKKHTLFFIAFNLLLTSFAHTTTQRPGFEGMADEEAMYLVRSPANADLAGSGSSSEGDVMHLIRSPANADLAGFESASSNDGSDMPLSSHSWTPPQSPRSGDVPDENARKADIIRACIEAPVALSTSPIGSSEIDGMSIVRSPANAHLAGSASSSEGEALSIVRSPANANLVDSAIPKSSSGHDRGVSLKKHRGRRETL